MSSMMSPGMHPVLAALDGIDAHLDDLGDANLWSLLDSESLEVRATLERLSSRLYAAKLASTRDVDSRAAAIKAGAPSTRDWLINRLRIHPGEASREVGLSARLVNELPVTTAALAAGEVTGAAVAVIADCDAERAKFAPAGERAEAEAALVEHARTLNVRHLQNAALHLRHRLDPDNGDRLAKEEQQQVARREFSLRIQPDGSSRPDGYLDKEATVFLRTALDPLAKPRPAADGDRDPRTPAQRRGDALVELVELALRSGNLAPPPGHSPRRVGRPDRSRRFAVVLPAHLDRPPPGTPTQPPPQTPPPARPRSNNRRTQHRRALQQTNLTSPPKPLLSPADTHRPRLYRPIFGPSRMIVTTRSVPWWGTAPIPGGEAMSTRLVNEARSGRKMVGER